MKKYKDYSTEKITVDGKERTRYEWTQEMRRTETAIRYERDAETVLKASGDKIGARESIRKQQALKDYYDKISKATGNKMDFTRAQSAINSLTNSEKSGKIDIRIDELTPCLRDMKTGKLVDTYVESVSDVSDLKLRGWAFNWKAIQKEGYEIYALRTSQDSELQGLLSTKVISSEAYVKVGWVEAAPHNSPYEKGEDFEKKYNGVGGHLFAEACKQSWELHYDGYVGFEAKTGLIEYYKKALHATQLGYSQQMMIEPQAAVRLLNRYYGGDKDDI